MKSSIIILLLPFLLVGCAEKKSRKKQDKNIALETVKEFYKWYSDNHIKVESFPIVHIADSDSINRVNVPVVNQYINYLKSSNLFTDYFTKNLYNYIIECDSILKEMKQVDEPPYGLDYDLILLTQECDYELDNYKNKSYSVITTNNNSINIVYTTLDKYTKAFRVNIIDKKIDSIWNE